MALGLPLLFLALAFGLATPSPLPQEPQAGPVVTLEKVQYIAPESSSCTNAPQPHECRTAALVAPILNEVFTDHNIECLNEKAALIALMAFETGDFKYQKNHFPGIPGQGTRNMQSPKYNLMYAKSIPELAPKMKSPTPNSPEEVLQLLIDVDKYDFGSAAWFLTTQCSPSIRGGLQNGGYFAWKSYLSSCVGVETTNARDLYWQRAIQAFGLNP